MVGIMPLVLLLIIAIVVVIAIIIVIVKKKSSKKQPQQPYIPQQAPYIPQPVPYQQPAPVAPQPTQRKQKLTTYDGDLPYIFISYAHADAETVLPIIAELQLCGFRIWFDQGIEAATEWPEYIAQHLQNADSVIVFMSNAAAASKNCRREINFSIDINKEPLVVYLEQVELSLGLKMQLNTLQAMFKYHSDSDAEFIEELAKAKILQNARQ